VVKWLLAGTATALVVLAAWQLDATSMRAGVLAADVRWLGVAVLLHLLIQPVGALQWRALLPAAVPITWRRVLRLFALTSVANNSASTIVGHTTGVALMAAEPGIGSRGALSLLLLDQLAVGVAKLAILLLAASRAPLPEWMYHGLLTVGGAVALLAVVATVLHRWPRLPLVGALTMVPAARLLAGVACALGIRTLEAGGIMAVQLAFGLPCTATSVVYVLAATTLASLIPVIPANLGAYEAAVFVALRQVGVAPEQAMLVAVVQHGCQLLAALTPGAVFAWMSVRRVPSSAT